MGRANYSTAGVDWRNLAVSNSTGNITFCISPGAESFLDHIMMPGDRCKGKPTVVNMTTLDENLGAIDNIRMIKVDTEGFDGRVLHGATELLKRARPTYVLIEFNPRWMMGRAGTNPVQVLAWLQCLGYSISPLQLHAQISKKKAVMQLRRSNAEWVKLGGRKYVELMLNKTHEGFGYLWTDMLAELVDPAARH
eukprot:CAMPEP_0174285942 /NCGR_PEP_ID=MMETSP0809-20121228/10049_1 /TAXON_ID=73025 ORGANISM="Eutreptiella gymnastica-like, Strain CCMP1594" /NCGR_SAMPLE_ID=MMETSP0809 /ASSEMBLY_ACC=CAM_ASM_000658 /LENGTH=193 /DNA_ID=CAMNT_0015381835 /DNA_START=337 /DNA_END=918 /DNA_ORIENTATION=+